MTLAFRYNNLKKKNHQYKESSMKNFMALALIFSILVLSGSLHGEKKGADLEVEKKDGTQAKGELIAVKENSLLLLTASMADWSVGIGDIRTITIVKKSKADIGAIIGATAMGSTAIIIADRNRTSRAWRWTALLTIPSAIIGASMGAAAGTDETIQIEGRPDSEIMQVLEKLRKRALIKNYQ